MAPDSADLGILAKEGITAPALTSGGFHVNEETGMLLDQRETDISRSYAVGRNAVGLCSENYVCGLSLADCVFSGRKAGKHAAQTGAARVHEY